MKLKIREMSEKINYLNTSDSYFDFYRLKIIQVVKYVVLYTDE